MSQRCCVQPGCGHRCSANERCIPDDLYWKILTPDNVYSRTVGGERALTTGWVGAYHCRNLTMNSRK
ncbi:hypothetical protein ANCDUO_12076 [Ancylostoma duodenale]|uniref:Uncharacterized protein n=1 Tax=Ancylostoma duodenale TaxID=51022 RepID=A0A0C2G9T1_9BILA|nr:hypothetical protein ANCDUO_12076 [Ancylostoma duodenale]